MMAVLRGRGGGRERGRERSAEGREGGRKIETKGGKEVTKREGGGGMGHRQRNRLKGLKGGVEEE
jgi:hypothetical protein